MNIPLLPKCPLCGGQNTCERRTGDRNGFQSFFCRTYKVQYSLGDNILNLSSEEEKKDQLLDLAVEELVHRPSCTVEGSNSDWYLYYDPTEEEPERFPVFYLNLADRLNNYPNSMVEKVQRGLLNLSFIYPNYGDIIDLKKGYGRAIFARDHNNSMSRFSIVDFYEELGYLQCYRTNEKLYRITAEGWKKVDDLLREEQTLKQAFVAMQFGNDTRFIREAFRQAIRESGYQEKIIDEKEHNNQIVPEILFEIQRSRFLVVDITFPNFGAYYEAGYGQALGKEVIICCRKEEFESTEKGKKPHFDISQKSMIVWNNEEDLVERLKKRIEATVK